MKRHLLNVAVGLSISLVCLVVLNLAAGLIIQNRYIHLKCIGRHTAGGSYGYFVPHQQKRIMFPGLPSYRVTIDGLGLRKTKPIPAAKAAGKYRILSVGDSHTFGLFIDDEASYPYLLQRALDRHSQRFEVLNAGIGSTSLPDHRYYLERVGMRLEPNLVIVSFCANDFREMMERRVPFYEKVQRDAEYGFWEGMVKTIKNTKLYRLFVSVELIYKYQRSLAKTNDKRIARILRTNSRAPEDIRAIAAYNAEPMTRDPADPQLMEQWTTYLAELDALHRFLAERHTALLVILYPDLLEILEPQSMGAMSLMVKHLEERHIPSIDLTPLFRERHETLLTLFNQPPRDFHLSKAGNQLLVDQIEAVVQAQPIL